MRWLTLCNWLLILGLWLTGCDLPRGIPESDIGAFVPPTGTVTPAGTIAVAQAGAVIRLEPATPQVNVGDVFDVAIRIDNVTNLAGAQLELQFNPALLQVQDADPGQGGTQIRPGNFPVPNFIASNVVTNTTGQIQYAAVQLPPTAPVSGNGWLATITFQAIVPGVSALDFTEAILTNNQALPLLATTQSGQITVGQGPTSTPTFTPVPGQVTATFTPIPGTPTFTPVIPTPIVVTPTPLPTNTPLPTPTPTATNTPAAPAVEIPPGATVGFCYRVQPGETLYSLGQKFNVDPQFILVVNDIYPPGYVFPQQTLFIPQQYGTGPNVYIVQGGETLGLIAEQCRLPVAFLAAVNGLPENAN